MFFLHLIDILAQIEKLGTILYSAIYNAKSLVLVSVMGIFFTIIFCTVTFSNYMKNVYSSSDSVEDMCDGVMDCVTQLYVSGAIGETMEEFEILRFTYDIIYITFFDMLFGNIVSGLMLDAFSSLREAADELDNDKKNKCYICNMDREALEKQGDDFKNHTKNKHFLWNYIFYILVLEKKDETDYTGL
jgi:inositol 1,4,5-triphosphate receptor type 1/inositol 1,4,5-triphosphate receptor type 3